MPRYQEYRYRDAERLTRLVEACHAENTFVVWCALRAADTAGRGWLLLRTGLRTLKSLDGEMDSRTRRQAIRDGRNVFFDFDRKTGRLYLRGQQHVIEALAGGD